MPALQPDADWMNPEASWWAKTRRAEQLIADVTHRCEALNRPGVGWRLEREPHDDHAWLYTFRQPQSIPSDIAVIVGDTIHNLRSALDNAAHFLAARHICRSQHRELTTDEELLTEFPIMKTWSEFDKWLNKDRGKGASKIYRHQLFGPADVKALRCVQPFALAEEAGLVGEADDDVRRAELDLLTDAGYALNTVWNIDKHRRLPSLSWQIEMIYWTDQDAEWQSSPQRQLAVTDGEPLGIYRQKSCASKPDSSPVIELAMHLDDNPYRSAPLTDALERFHQELTRWVLPRMFCVADGNPPPIMINFAPPVPDSAPPVQPVQANRSMRSSS